MTTIKSYDDLLEGSLRYLRDNWDNSNVGLCASGLYFIGKEPIYATSRNFAYEPQKWKQSEQRVIDKWLENASYYGDANHSALMCSTLSPCTIDDSLGLLGRPAIQDVEDAGITTVFVGKKNPNCDYSNTSVSIVETQNPILRDICVRLYNILMDQGREEEFPLSVTKPEISKDFVFFGLD